MGIIDPKWVQMGCVGSGWVGEKTVHLVAKKKKAKDIIQDAFKKKQKKKRDNVRTTLENGVRFHLTTPLLPPLREKKEERGKKRFKR